MSLKQRIAAKLRGKSGESLAETMIATLIAALALVMLAGAVSAAANVITRSKTAMKTYNSTTVTGVQSDWRQAAKDALIK